MVVTGAGIFTVDPLEPEVFQRPKANMVTLKRDFGSAVSSIHRVGKDEQQASEPSQKLITLLNDNHPSDLSKVDNIEGRLLTAVQAMPSVTNRAAVASSNYIKHEVSTMSAGTLKDYLQAGIAFAEASLTGDKARMDAAFKGLAVQLSDIQIGDNGFEKFTHKFPLAVVRDHGNIARIVHEGFTMNPEFSTRHIAHFHKLRDITTVVAASSIPDPAKATFQARQAAASAPESHLGA